MEKQRWEESEKRRVEERRSRSEKGKRQKKEDAGAKMLNTPHARITFEGSDVVLRGRRKGFCTLPKVSKT